MAEPLAPSDGVTGPNQPMQRSHHLVGLNGYGEVGHRGVGVTRSANPVWALRPWEHDLAERDGDQHTGLVAGHRALVRAIRAGCAGIRRNTGAVAWRPYADVRDAAWRPMG